MLEDLLRGQEASPFVLITAKFSDTSQSNGRHLILNWMESMLQRCEKLVVLCFERSPDFFKCWLPRSLHHKLVCIDGEEQEDEEGEPHYTLDLAVQSVNQSKGSSTCVVIDSLSLPIMMRPTPLTCSQLHKIARADHVIQVASIVHRDVTDEADCNLLEHQASSVLDLLPCAFGQSQICHVRHCRSTGKVFKTKECFEFDERFHIHKIRPLKPDHSTQQPQVPAPQEPNPVSDLDLSFKLQLSESEIEARSQVVLPYLKDSSSLESTSKIIYEADDADDFDEEDPDDDLNI